MSVGHLDHLLKTICVPVALPAFHLGCQRQHSGVICSCALLLSSRVLHPSLVTLCSHKSGRCAVELYHASHLWYPPFYTSPMASSALQHWTASPTLWLDLQPVDIKSWWRHNWKSAQVVNSHLVCDPTIRQPGFDLPRQQWSLLNCFRTEQGHCSACRRKWRLTDTDLCPCGKTQTMSHIVESCPLKSQSGTATDQMNKRGTLDQESINQSEED